MGAFAILPSKARAAEFEYKLGSDNPPTVDSIIRLNEAVDKIFDETGGRVRIRIFPSSQLGNTSEQISQMRSGALEFYHTTYGILAAVVPRGSMCTLGFLFDDLNAAFAAMDGELGDFLNAEVEKTGNILVVSKASDSGFRNTNSGSRPVNGPADLKGFKLRTPPNPVLTSLFTSLGAAPTVIPFGELYTALQTGLVDGAENPVSLMVQLKLWEVQKNVTLDGHTWDSWATFANRAAWERLPEDLQEIVRKNLDEAQLKQRVDSEADQKRSVGVLEENGINIIRPEPGVFQKALAATSFYADWKQQYGDEAWAVLERTTNI
ncbi:MAG: TRAP transporter substrate-binding protein [Rhizobiaceae bacterium]|nr:TRAP transporter substrate-binding protein [Rhizobiaceae bacterium]